MSATRRRLRSLAWVALWAFVCSLALPVAGGHPLGADDDGACLVGSTWGSGDAPQLGAPRADNERPGHCVFCHWLRAMSGALASDVVALAAPVSPFSSGIRATCLVPATALAAASSRAPPVSA